MPLESTLTAEVFLLRSKSRRSSYSGQPFSVKSGMFVSARSPHYSGLFVPPESNPTQGCSLRAMKLSLNGIRDSAVIECIVRNEGKEGDQFRGCPGILGILHAGKALSCKERELSLTLHAFGICQSDLKWRRIRPETFQRRLQHIGRSVNQRLELISARSAVARI